MLPQTLELQVNDLVRGGTVYPASEPGESGFWLKPPPPAYHPAAPGAAVAFDRLLRPAHASVITSWLGKLSSGVNQAPSEEAMPVRVAGILTACAALPAGVWTEETLQHALRTFEWWPSAAAVYGLLSPYANKLRATRDALQRIVRAREHPPPSEPRPEPTPAERVHVQQLVEAFAAERSYNQDDQAADRPRPKSLPASDRQLLAIYEQGAKGGNPAAVMRAKQLREKLAAAQPSS